MLISAAIVYLYTCVFTFRRELHRVRDEHKRAAEERQLREEELWRLHESHKHEIDEHRQKLTQIAEENLAQHQRAEEELGYAQECLQQEKDACEYSVWG